MDDPPKRKASEQREPSLNSSSANREETNKKRTKREASKETPKGATAKKEPAKPRKITEARKKTHSARSTKPLVRLGPRARRSPR